MTLINIGNINDPFYRYKMPQVKTTFTRKHGLTTIVDNTIQISKSINRESSHIAKYISKYMGLHVISKINWTFKGNITNDSIQTCINSYIRLCIVSNM